MSIANTAMGDYPVQYSRRPQLPKRPPASQKTTLPEDYPWEQTKRGAPVAKPQTTTTTTIPKTTTTTTIPTTTSTTTTGTSYDDYMKQYMDMMSQYMTGQQSSYDNYLSQYQSMWDDYNKQLQNQYNSNVAGVDAKYGDEMSKLRGMLGSYGTLGSGVGGDVLGRGVADWATAKSSLVSDLAAQQGANNLSAMQWMGNYGLQADQNDLNKMLGLGNLGLGYGQLGLQGQQLSLDRELGLGQLGLQGQQLDLNRYLGMGQLQLGQGQLGLDTALGMGGLGLQQQQQNLNTVLGMGNLDLQSQQLALDKALGLGNLDLQTALGMGNLGLQQQQLANTAYQSEAQRQHETQQQAAQITAQIDMLGMQLQDKALDRSAEADQFRINAGIQMQQLANQLQQIQTSNAVQMAGLQLDRDTLSLQTRQQQFNNLMQLSSMYGGGGLSPTGTTTTGRNPLMGSLLSAAGLSANPTGGGSGNGLLGLGNYGSTITPNMMKTAEGRDLLSWNKAAAGEQSWEDAFRQTQANKRSSDYLTSVPNWNWTNPTANDLFGIEGWQLKDDRNMLLNAGYGANGQLSGLQSLTGASMPAQWGTQQARNNLDQFYQDANQFTNYARNQLSLGSQLSSLNQRNILNQVDKYSGSSGKASGLYGLGTGESAIADYLAGRNPGGAGINGDAIYNAIISGLISPETGSMLTELRFSKRK